MIRPRFPLRSGYRGRLSFDAVSGFHLDPHGRKVVTDDAGKTWRYARRGDPSHQARYQRRLAAIEATTDLAHAAGDPDHAHHLEPLEADPHYAAEAPGRTRLVTIPDAAAGNQTSHTDAWPETPS